MLRAIKHAVLSFMGADWFLTISAVRQIHRHYEPSFQEFLSAIPSCGTMLDVGANIGITCAITKRRRPDINLIAFEPVPQNLKIIRRIQTLYSIRKLQIHAMALGDTEGRVSLAIPAVDGLPATGLTHVISAEFNNPDVERHPFKVVDVSIRTLDSFQFERIDAIKVDVEDHEFHVLNGAKRILNSFRPVVFCELWDTANRPRTIALMRSLGYSVTQKGDIDFLFIHREKSLCPIS